MRKLMAMGSLFLCLSLICYMYAIPHSLVSLNMKHTLAAWDYCVSNSGVTKETRMPTKRPATGPAPAPSPPIKSIGNNACKNGSCRLCEGDCDSDADCGGGLRCFQRDNLEAVPGCMGSGHGAWDYCIANP